METASRQPKEKLRQLAGYLGRLGTIEKLLVASVAIIVAMAFFLVSQYAGGGSAVQVAVLTDAAEQSKATAALRERGIEVETNAQGEILVRSDHVLEARGLLMEERIGPTQTASFIERLIESRSWMNSRQDNHQQYWALYSEHLSELLSYWRTLRHAQVNIDMPEQAGLGRAHRSPSASVMVWPVGGELPQDTVDAIAEGVAGSVAGLEPEAVKVVDGVSGMAYQSHDRRRLTARHALEQTFEIERILEGKIAGFLRDIPDLSISVLARVDNTRRTQQSQRYEKPMSGMVSESRTERVQQNAQQGGVAGTRSNEPLSVSQGSATGSIFTETTEDTAFENRFPTTTENLEDPGGDIQGVSVMLGVPRSYVLRLLEQERPAPVDDAEPTPPSAEDVASRFDLVRSDLESRIQLVLGNVVSGDPADVAVTVSMLRENVQLVNGSVGGGLGFGGGRSGGASGFMGLASGGIIDKAVLGVLALVSLAMMAMLVRKATKKAELPTAEELVGIPPAFQTDSDLYGEADEGDVPMSGIELDEDQVRAGKMLDQVGELVSASPETAASLLQSWVAASHD
ncbi:MAG: flagellar M-ring protein FliF C-terminal domain-containing protein [Phycisphaerales bacterium JB060]